jgi:predicted DNA-binding protein
MTKQPEENTQQLSINLDQQTYNLLHNFCLSEGRSKKWVVTNAIKEFIEEISPRI